MSELPIGTVHHGAKMAQQKKKVAVDPHDYHNAEITTDYLNKKMEGMMTALFDTLGESEERIKDLELQVWKLTEKLNAS
jgi:hypothetical protein